MYRSLGRPGLCTLAAMRRICQFQRSRSREELLVFRNCATTVARARWLQTLCDHGGRPRIGVIEADPSGSVLQGRLEVGVPVASRSSPNSNAGSTRGGRRS
jgi:hypothetical protein